jgi:hypothetical protein
MEGISMSAYKAKKADSAKMEFNLLLGVAFTVFFIAVAFNRLLPKRLRWNISGHDEGQSIFGAARHAAHESVPFAFM